MQPPHRYLALLEIADESAEGRQIIRDVLNVAGPQAYRDVAEPLGESKTDAWLLALLQPKIWRTCPEWVTALEWRLSRVFLPSNVRPIAALPGLRTSRKYVRKRVASALSRHLRLSSSSG